MIETCIQMIADLLLRRGFAPDRARPFAVVACLGIVLALAIAVAGVVRIVVGRAVRRRAGRHAAGLAAVRLRALGSALRFGVVLFCCWSVPQILQDYADLSADVAKALTVLAILLAVPAASRAIDCVQLLASARVHAAGAFSLKSAAQVLKILVWFAAAVCVVAELFGESPVYVLSGMGAMTAVLMLVFKDPIVGLVAGVQIAQNDMVRVGDWIEVPGSDADGEVVEIALTTVKVRNWDNTVTMLPSYGLISGAFKNWRYMAESGGRRIKRAVRVDMRSVRFCTDEMLDRFSRIDLVRGYLAAKRAEIAAANAAGPDASVPANGRRLTNLGVFEAYLLACVKGHPQINQTLTVMVRQLAPDENGLPVEIYAFTKEKSWTAYEAVQTDIFDHILAVIDQFGLCVYQRAGAAAVPSPA